jgi:predicted acyltransferase
METPANDDRYQNSRLASLDALRGFDMMFIMGGDSIGHALEHWKAAESGPLQVLAQQLNHVAWEGFRFYDLIFPLFVFIAGVSLVFALAKAEERGGKAAAARRVIKRGVILYLIGIIYYGGWGNEIAGREGIEGIRLFGVLQRIAICYLCAGLLYLYLKPRGLLFAAVGLLGGYWALMSFVPMPGLDQVSFEEGKNLANWVDSKYVPFFKWDGSHDPEGLLSTLPAIGTCLLGVFVGMFLRCPKTTEQQKVLWLAGAGVAAIVLGYFWGLQFPVIKKLWTSSYVLVAAGWSALFMALFYWAIDVKGHSRWAQPFIWIGLNPITIYLLGNIMNFDDLVGRVLGGPIKGFADGLSHGLGDLIIALGGIGLAVFFCWWLHRRKLYFRV